MSGEPGNHKRGNRIPYFFVKYPDILKTPEDPSPRSCAGPPAGRCFWQCPWLSHGTRSLLLISPQFSPPNAGRKCARPCTPFVRLPNRKPLALTACDRAVVAGLPASDSELHNLLQAQRAVTSRALLALHFSVPPSHPTILALLLGE
jgi:hypothetical protein